MLTTARSSTTTQRLYSFKLAVVKETVHNTAPGCYPMRRTLFFAVSFPDQRPTVIGLGAKLVHTREGAAFSCLLIATLKDTHSFSKAGMVSFMLCR